MLKGERRIRNSSGRTVASVTTLGLALSGLFAAEELWRGSPRLISIQEIPEVGESCYRPSEDSGFNSSRENLFAAFDPTPVHAQNSVGGEDVVRPPVRHIW